MQDIALYLSCNQAGRKHWGLAQCRPTRHKPCDRLDKLPDPITGNGPVKSSDFERSDGRTTG